MSNIQYRKEIDGLRAVAVLPVVIFHLNNDWLPGGYIGVDVFFVISGFLITSIIIDQHSRGEFRFSNFYKRRVRRILPALLVMVFTTLAVGNFVLYGPDVNDLGEQGLASLLSYANFSHMFMAGNYWGHEAENSPLLHTWSLSVEEQYYLIFPIILVFILKYCRHWTTTALSILCLISIIIFLVGSKIHPTATFYMLPTRAWELGAGSVLAAAVSSGCKLQYNFNSMLSSIGLLLVIASYFILSGNDGVTGLLVIPVLGVVLIIGFSNNRDNLVNRFLSMAPFVHIGKISYSLYLWHWPVLVYASQLTTDNAGLAYFTSVIFIMLFLSIASYHLIEAPARRHDKALPVIFTGVLIGIVASVFLKLSSFTEDTSMYSRTEWHGNLYSVNPNQQWSESAKKRLTGITLFPSDVASASVYALGGIQKLYGGEQPEIVLLGDSHALMWAKVLDEVAQELSTSISFYSADGTPPFFDVPPTSKAESLRYFTANQKFEFDTARLKYLAEWRPKVVVMVGRWDRQEIDDVTDLVKYIGSLGSKILLIEQPPLLYFGDRNTPQYLSYLNMFPKTNIRQYVPSIESMRFGEGVDLIDQLEVDNDFVFSLQISDIYSNNQDAWVLDSNDVLYIDEDHLSYSGSLKAKSRISRSLEAILAVEQ